MLTKELVLEQLKDLPDKFSIDELMEKLLFIYKLETALEESKNGKVTSNEVIKKEYKKWL
jgi:hypothetical protein